MHLNLTFPSTGWEPSVPIIPPAPPTWAILSRRYSTLGDIADWVHRHADADDWQGYTAWRRRLDELPLTGAEFDLAHETLLRVWEGGR